MHAIGPPNALQRCLTRKAHEAKARVKAIEASGEFKKRVIRAKDEVLVNKKRLEARLKPLKLEQAHMENDVCVGFGFSSDGMRQRLRSTAVEFIRNFNPKTAHSRFAVALELMSIGNHACHARRGTASSAHSPTSSLARRSIIQ
jgi:hypothetical protein